MSLPRVNRPRILFLYSDTGGGHRSAAEAVLEALHRIYGDRIQTTMVDIFKDYAPRPLNRMPEWYPIMVRVPQAWGLGYRLSDGRYRSRLLTEPTWLYVRRNAQALVEQNPADLIVSFHPLANSPALRVLKGAHPPYVTVVTDLVTGHTLWFDPRVDLCIVPTELAYLRAIEAGMKPEQLQVIGLPVAERFCQPPGEKDALRQRLGWRSDLLIVLLMGGGEGMGPMEKIAYAVDAAQLPIGLVIVTGRNAKLEERLKAYKWRTPTWIYGFVREMPEFMHAADILLTKAGPSTICEAFIAGLPMILYSRLPGQEDGNVHYVTSHGAGIWSPRAERVVVALKEWIEQPQKRRQAAEACRRLARPQAAQQIAQILAAKIGVES
jgi:1,2-diacylglycerol 3-beta-galactosyltransferase